ncbi:ribosomal protein S5 domain 2-type protein [Hypoxylon sp. NC1633]|nr:ribosomal protein S5 domain 2-type protein [Hypoxylon sp. NC1633]
MTTLVTIRGPLLLVFVVELLRYTMPEQPPSSRLSLAKAFANESVGNKATSAGFSQDMRAAEEGWGSGQPTVTIMGRKVIVLKRGGYDWAGNARDQTPRQMAAAAPPPASGSESNQDQLADQPVPTWSASSPVSIKRSVVIIRTTPITAPGKRQRILQSLFTVIPGLTAAKHNVWAYRIGHPDTHGAHTVIEAAFDDGHTGCGHALLEAMRKTGTINTLAVMTQWQGGITIGSYLWVMMRSCLEEIRAERLRETGAVTIVRGEAVWGLDLEAMRKRSTISAMHAGPASYRAGGIDLSVYEPQAVKSYLLRSLAVRVETAGNCDGGEVEDGTTYLPEPNVDATQPLEGEEEQNLARLTGAIRLLYSSWADHLSNAELDRKAWAWYISVRPGFQNGSLEKGVRGPVKLVDILNLRRKE